MDESDRCELPSEGTKRLFSCAINSLFFQLSFSFRAFNMPFSITIPRLGWSMEEGTFVRWLKKDGDVVRPGDAVFELEGEKAAQDIEAVDSGILRIPHDAPKPGTVVAVGAVIGFLVGDGEAVPNSINANTSTSASIPKSDAPSASAIVQSLPSRLAEGHEAPAAAPSVRRLAELWLRTCVPLRKEKRCRRRHILRKSPARVLVESPKSWVSIGVGFMGRGEVVEFANAT